MLYCTAVEVQYCVQYTANVQLYRTVPVRSSTGCTYVHLPTRGIDPGHCPGSVEYGLRLLAGTLGYQLTILYILSLIHI